MPPHGSLPLDAVAAERQLHIDHQLVWVGIGSSADKTKPDLTP